MVKILSETKHISRSKILSTIIIIIGVVAAGFLIYLYVSIGDKTRINNFNYLNDPPSTTGTGSMVVYEIMVCDILVGSSYEVYFGLSWIKHDEKSVDYSCYFERYTVEYLNSSMNSTISSNVTYSYKWDSEINNNTIYSAIVWIQLFNTETRKYSLNYLNITNWNYNIIIDHNSALYNDSNWFWLAHPEALGANFAGGVSLKFELKSSFNFI